MEKQDSKLPAGKVLRDVLFVVILTRLALLVVGFAATYVITLHEREFYSPLNRLLHIWVNMDSGWYQNIVEQGYMTGPSVNSPHQANYAFFPLYPLLVKGLNYFLQNSALSGVVVANVFLVVAMFVLYRFVEDKYDAESAFRTVVYMLAFPASLFFSAMYTESLFLTLIVAAFYFGNKGRWFWAGVIGYLAALTRVNGVLLALPLCLMYLHSKNYSLRKIRPDVLWIGLIPLGLLTYSVYLYLHTGDYLAFQHIQKAWGHSTSFALWGYLKNPYITGVYGADFGPTSFGIIVVVLLLIVLVFKNMGYIYGLYSTVAAIMPLMAGTLLSSFRYSAVIFPVFIVLARYGQNRYIDLSYMNLALVLSGYAMVVFATGHGGGIM